MSDIKARFRDIVQWQKNGKRAPHKPLMLLLALGRYRNGNYKFEFSEIEEELTELLVKFGPARDEHHPDQPFWRLGRNEGIFQLSNHEGVRQYKDGSANKTDLRQYHVAAQFSEEIRKALDADAKLVSEIATDIVLTHFQSSYLDDLLESVGLAAVDELGSKRVRDPKFRDRIINAYGSRCAVCQFHLVVGKVAIGLEAAHIKWHNAGGPDSTDNGLSLCPMHHKLFDYGVFMIEPDSFRIRISPQAHAFGGAVSYLGDFEGAVIWLPMKEAEYPSTEYLRWHVSEKYKI